jgi:hypothetical protein
MPTPPSFYFELTSRIASQGLDALQRRVLLQALLPLPFLQLQIVTLSQAASRPRSATAGAFNRAIIAFNDDAPLGPAPAALSRQAAVS